MAEVFRLNTKDARLNPEKVFNTPEAIADTQALTRGQKLAALATWQFDVQRRLDAAAEGMKTSGTAGRDTMLLQRIFATMALLERRVSAVGNTETT